MYNEIPIIRYKVIQTGPKIYPGGLNDGLFNAAYQFPILLTVKIEPIIPADWQINMLIINLKKFFK
jgi:hypothetical protein